MKNLNKGNFLTSNFTGNIFVVINIYNGGIEMIKNRKTYRVSDKVIKAYYTKNEISLKSILLKL